MLQAMDVVAFTGSARTGARIRSNPACIENSVRVNIEADSINSAVLGPDCDIDDDTFTRDGKRMVRVLVGVGPS